MVRINLLPAEIIERRRYERFYPYLFIGGAIGLAVIVVMWLGLQLYVSQRNDQLQQTQETVNSLTAQAQALAIFEQQRQQLAQRQSIATQALAGRIDMGRILEEVSLVLPDKVWLTHIGLDENSGALFDAVSPNSAEPDVTDGYKSVAATLVRLNSLADLYDVWLTAASSGLSEVQGSDSGEQTVIFGATSKIVKPVAPTADSAVPAPPTTTGQ